MADDETDVCLAETDAIAYAEGLGDDAARLHIEAHLDRCDECRWLVSELARATPSGSPPRQIGRYRIGERLGSGGMGVVYAAYDPQLDRHVALKLVRPGAAEGGQARLLAEARAMARLTHLNVVQVYDVTSAGDDVVIAMELVDGEDARRWLARHPPSWQTALAVLAPVGRGLAAAHAAGLVHRDVKPANVLIGRDGRARITDFGLARATPLGDAPAPVAPGAASGDPLRPATRSGAMIGTPAYMAPEQRRGDPATPRSDQFSFTIVLYEAIYGERPFASAGAAPEVLQRRLAEVAAGRVQPLQPGARVPAWLRRILVRGLAIAPADRWPSLADMLDRLEQTPRRRRRRWLVAGAAAAAVAMAAVLIADRRALAANDCAEPTEALERSFAGAAWAAARARIAGLGAYGEVVSRQVDASLAGFRRRWLDGHRDACLAHRSGAQSDALLDLRMACLERGRASLAAAGDVLREAGTAELAAVVAAVESLPDPASCHDATALLAQVAPPPRELAASVASADAALARADVQRNAGRLTEARSAAAGVVARARAMAYPPLLARALLAEGRAAIQFDNRLLATPALAEATRIAIEAGDDALAVEAWARGAYAKGTSTAGPADALAGLELIEPLARRLPASSFARALLDNNVGNVELAHSHRKEAAERLERAWSEARKVHGPDPIELFNIRQNAATMIDDPARRDAALAELEADVARALGADHPEALRLRALRGKLAVNLVAARELLASACANYERFHLAVAASPTTECWAELGYIAEELGDRTAALGALGRIDRLPGDGGDISAEPAGYRLLFGGDAPAAAVHFARALAEVPPVVDLAWWRRLERGKLALGLGRARRAAGDPRAARDALDEAIAALDDIARQHPNAVITRRLARALAAYADALAATGAPPERVAAAARRALALLRDEGGRSEAVAALARDGALLGGSRHGLADSP